MGLSSGFKADIKRWLAAKGLDVDEVLDFEEEEVSSGYCESCYYESTEVNVIYRDSYGVSKTYYHCGSFADLVHELCYDEER